MAEKTIFEKLYDRLQEIITIDRQLQPVDDMLDKNIDALPERYATYIRASLELTDMLRHDRKLIEALAAINKEQSEIRAGQGDKLANVAHQMLPENAIILISASPETLVKVLRFCIEEESLLESALNLLDIREKLELKRIIDKEL